jgi:hypothetical protein
VPRESLDSVRSVKFEISEPMRFYFRQLKAGGLHGDVPTEIVRTLVRDQILLLVEKGQLVKPQRDKG